MVVASTLKGHWFIKHVISIFTALRERKRETDKEGRRKETFICVLRAKKAENAVETILARS